MAKASDFLKKQPSKNERVFSELTMYLHDVDHRIWSVASQVLAMALVQKIDPKKMAELLTGGDDKLQEYAKQINEEIKKIEAVKAEKNPEAQNAHAEHDHTGHSHAEIPEMSEEEELSPEGIPVE
jgi:hypothetical protein